MTRDGAAASAGRGATSDLGDAAASGFSRTVAPQAGQRAFLPADVAGAFSFLPQEQTTVMEFSPAIEHRPFDLREKPKTRFRRQAGSDHTNVRESDKKFECSRTAVIFFGAGNSLSLHNFHRAGQIGAAGPPRKPSGARPNIESATLFDRSRTQRPGAWASRSLATRDLSPASVAPNSNGEAEAAGAPGCGCMLFG